jgi:hypothetical protein
MVSRIKKEKGGKQSKTKIKESRGQAGKHVKMLKYVK